MDITPEVLQVLFTSFSNIYQSSLTSYQPWLDEVATVIPSSSETLTLGFMGKLMKAREWVGPRVLHNIEAHAQKVTNLKFENTVSVARTRIEDDTIGVYSPLFQMLGLSAAQAPEVELIKQIVANATGFDGLSMFNANHTLDPAGVQSNSFSLALDSTNYAAVRAAMMAFKGDDGLPLGIVPDTLMVPPALEGAAKLLMNGQFYPVAGAAAMTNIWQGTAKVMVNRQLTDATRWYLLDTSKPIKPFVWSQRSAPELVPLINPSDPNVFFQDEFIYGVRLRGAAAMGPWYLAATSKP